MGFEWTKEQQAVIDTRHHSVLVSAAAGSGKTAVLVERIVAMLTDEEHPVDIERLIVVTFTKAAAAEMRERIGRGIERKLLEQPENRKWIRQKLLLSYANISTIHSLCLNLIRDHFDTLDLDPSFRMADEAELKIMQTDVAADVMEVYYASDHPQFREFVDRYARGRTDSGIEEMIIQIYTYAQGHPWPEYWLKQCCRQYEIEGTDMSGHPMIIYAMAQMKETVDKCRMILEEAEKICLMEDGPALYAPMIASDREWIGQLDAAQNYNETREILKNIKWMRMPSKKSKDVSEELKETVKNLRAEVKTSISDMEKRFFGQTEDMMAAEMAYIHPSMVMLTELVQAFSRQYAQAKADKNMLDFSDLEHYALKLLVNFREEEDGRMTAAPTTIADELSGYYMEIVCDEYQDSNLVQEMILDALSGERFDNYNRFMVGDVKQSIYRFRLADASIFMQKYDTYNVDADGGDGTKKGRMRINLHQNFRSRATVLQSINFFFRQFMIKDFGGISYDDDAALYPGMDYPEGSSPIAGQTEVLLVDDDRTLLENEDTLLSSVELEARAVAAKIRELTDPASGMDVFDSQTGCCRRAEYGDIVILLRTVTGWADVFVHVLGMENIPAAAEMSAGFFETMEIQTMTGMLSVVDNPGQDIPLAAVLKSPIGDLSSEELALIRGGRPEGSLYRACLDYGKDQPGYEKLQRFLQKLEKLRQASDYMEIDELLQYIYQLTGYYDYVQALPAGQRRKANLDLLAERAVTYGASSLTGLFNFVRYIEQLKKNEIDFGEASVPEDGGGRVGILSIHKSKGLEYPIVILAGMGKQVNLQDARRSYVIHPEYGIGLDAVNLDSRKKITTVFKRFIADQVVRDTLAEEMRILYVAMTRAKEKLVMTGTVTNLDSALKDWGRIDGAPDEPLPLYRIGAARTYFDWVMPCLMKTDAMEPVMTGRHLRFTRHGDDFGGLFDVRVTGVEQLLLREVQKTMEKCYRKETLLGGAPLEKTAAMEDVHRQLWLDDRWQYAYQEELHIKSKYTVSELKKSMDGMEDAESMFHFEPKEKNVETEVEEMPSFMKDEEAGAIKKKAPGGAFRGTAYHKVLELLDFAAAPAKKSLEWVKKELLRMLDSGKLAKDQYDRVNPYDIYALLFSDLGMRLEAADQKGLLEREAQFVMGVPVSMVDAHIQSEELVVVQGIIDACFEENGRWVLVDYKTDLVPEEGGDLILKERYGRQLDYYQYALEKITGKAVGERIIYSFVLKKAMTV